VKAACTESNRGRHIHRSFFADYLERVKEYQHTFAYQKALRKRQAWVEPRFAEGKQWHGMRRFRLRRLWQVNCEALVIASGQNLKRLVQQRGWGRRPFPSEAMAAIPPARRQGDVSLGAQLLKNGRVSVAVASLLAYAVEKRFFETWVYRFSRRGRSVVMYTSVTIKTTCFFSFFCSCPVFRVGLYNQAHVFSSKLSKGLFQQAGSFVKGCSFGNCAYFFTSTLKAKFFDCFVKPVNSWTVVNFFASFDQKWG
jgi:hypothetical protein